MKKKYKTGYLVKWEDQEKRYSLYENAITHYDRLMNKNISVEIIRLSDGKKMEGGKPLVRWQSPTKSKTNSMSLLKSTSTVIKRSNIRAPKIFYQE